MTEYRPVLEQLEALDIPYEITLHDAVYTIGQVETLGINQQGEVCKNLFLRDAKGRQHYLVVMRGCKNANLKELAEQIGSSKLSFASEERLQARLGLTQGSVTPLGVINDKEHSTIVVIDRELESLERLGVHPNHNTATVWLSFPDLIRFVESFGNKVIYVR